MDQDKLDLIAGDKATQKAGDIDYLAELIGNDPYRFAMIFRRIMVCPQADMADDARAIKDSVIAYIQTNDDVVEEAKAEYKREHGDDEPVDAMHEAGHSPSDFH